jgi:hypothetical protein
LVSIPHPSGAVGEEEAEIYHFKYMNMEATLQCGLELLLPGNFLKGEKNRLFTDMF